MLHMLELYGVAHGCSADSLVRHLTTDLQTDETTFRNVLLHLTSADC